MIDAFGVVRNDLVVSKASTELVPSQRAAYVGGNLVGHGIGGPDEPAKGRRTAPRGQRRYATTDARKTTAGAEFRRGAKGGAMGSSARQNPSLKVNATYANLRRENLGHGKRSDAKEGFRASRQANAQMKGAFQFAREHAANMSNHPHAVKAGVRAGRAGAFTARNPAVLSIGAAGALGAGAIAHEVHQADKKVRERKRAEVAKSSPFGEPPTAKRPYRASSGKKAAIVAGGVAAYTGAMAGVSEAGRRSANKKGANIGGKEQFRHPIRSSYKAQSANWRHTGERLERGAVKDDARAAAKPGTRRGELRTQFAANQRENANMSRFASGAYNTAAIHGGRKARKAGLLHEYDPKKKYTAPTEIGKSDAFGVARPDLVEKGIGSVIGSSAIGRKVGIGALKGATKVMGGAQRAMDTKAGTAVLGGVGRMQSKGQLKPLAAGVGIGAVGAGGIAAMNKDNR